MILHGLEGSSQTTRRFCCNLVCALLITSPRTSTAVFLRHAFGTSCIALLSPKERAHLAKLGPTRGLGRGNFHTKPQTPTILVCGSPEIRVGAIKFAHASVARLSRDAQVRTVLPPLLSTWTAQRVVPPLDWPPQPASVLTRCLTLRSACFSCAFAETCGRIAKV